MSSLKVLNQNHLVKAEHVLAGISTPSTMAFCMQETQLIQFSITFAS